MASGAAADGAVAGPRLGDVLSRGDRDRAIEHAHFTLGHRIPEIAAALGGHPETVRRRLAAMSHKGV